MAVLLLPNFVVDLQARRDGHFARRVLEKTISSDGTFKESANDHRYRGIEGAWIRYVSRGNTAYRVIFIRSGANIYLYRAGDHTVEDRLTEPKPELFDSAVPIGEPEASARRALREVSAVSRQETRWNGRFLQNRPTPQVAHAILSRRNLPHRDIWLVAPFVSPGILQPTGTLGKLLLDQVEDGASVALITRPPVDQEIGWLEQLDEREIGIYFYPRLHSKLYCFVLDDNRKFERGLPDATQLFVTTACGISESHRSRVSAW